MLGSKIREFRVCARSYPVAKQFKLSNFILVIVILVMGVE